MKKEFKGLIEESESNLWGSHIKVPEEISTFFKENKIKRFICSLNNSLKIHCGIMPSAEGPYILINKQIKTQLDKEGEKLISVCLSQDNSKYGMEMPIEFEQSMMEDETSFEYFENLTPGKQRNLIHLVNSVKNPDIKIRRAISIVEHLNREKGQIDFKKLNALIKEYNQRFKL
jgi:hypothetical protein